jgi:SAM-dependent methyltransferase
MSILPLDQVRFLAPTITVHPDEQPVYGGEFRTTNTNAVDWPFTATTAVPFTRSLLHSRFASTADFWDRALNAHPPTGQVLDVGSAATRGMVLVRLGRCGPAVGVDSFDHESPHAVVRNVVRARVNVRLYRAVWGALPFADASFSFITATLERTFGPGELTAAHSPAPPERFAVLGEIARVLKPGGTLLLLDRASAPAAEDAVRWLRRTGWTISDSFAGTGHAFGRWCCRFAKATKPNEGAMQR